MSKKEKPKYSDFTESNDTQLSLFPLLQNDRDDYSHTIELYDFIPKYLFGKPKRISGMFLKSIEREFICRKRRYILKMKPARIVNKKGEERDVYPGKREEMVEDALRKMAADGRSAKAVFLNGQLSVVFSRKALQNELKENGHTYDYDQLEEAIVTLFGVSIEINDAENEETRAAFHPIEAYGFKGHDGEDVTFVKFSPLVTESIQNNTFRLVNYKQLMSYSSTIARHLHKRMSHNFTQAALTEEYHISVNTIYRDFGLKRLRDLSLEVKEVVKGLEELMEAKVIENYQIREVFDERKKNKKIDFIFNINPHQKFIDEAISANRDAALRKVAPRSRGKSFRNNSLTNSKRLK
jgi:hypothetical protein